MWGAAILHATRIRNLVVRRGEETCPAELMRGIKRKLPISKLYIFGCTLFMRKRDRDVSKLEPKALEGKFVGYTEGDNGYLVYVPNTREVMAVRDVIINESEVGSIPDKVETADLLDEGSEQLGIWHPDDGHQENNRERQGTSTAIEEKWHDAGSVNTQETILRQEASNVEEAALDEGSTAKRGSQRDSESLKESDTDFSQSERVGFNKDALENADRAEPRRGTRARNVLQSFGEVSTHLAVTEGDYVETRNVYEAKQGDDWDQWYRAMKDEVKALQDNETWDLVGPPTDRDVIPGKWVYKLKIGPSGQVGKYKARYVAKGFKQLPSANTKHANTKHAMWQKTSNNFRNSFPALTNRGRSVSGTATGV